MSGCCYGVSIYLPGLDPNAVGGVGEQAGVDPHVLDHVGGPVLAEASDADGHVPWQLC